ncbi:MAG: sulfite oxidase [Anaerolineales bacterium]|nr:sulfite oxidase [Anaerolineales bacterium]
MAHESLKNRFRTVGDGSGFAPSDKLYPEELQLAARNRGMPLEGLRYAITPTGLHYLLVHYDIPVVNPADWRLEIGGLVDKPLRLSLDDLKQRPSQTLAVTMECAGNGRALMEPRHISQPWVLEAIGTAEWTGTPLQAVLEEAGVQTESAEILFTGLDRGVEGGKIQNYQRSLAIEDASREEVLLAYAMNGGPLEPQHGYPLRLLVPGWYGMTSVKWLTNIEAIAEPFDGYQMQKAYRYKQSPEEEGVPASLIKVRALMAPPGIPDFLTRTRLVEAGPVRLEGRAWAGRAGIDRVEVSADGGASWYDARLDPQESVFAWQGWQADWMATPGTYTLAVRATDSRGNVQPSEPSWNVGGYGNNVVQRVDVLVK